MPQLARACAETMNDFTITVERIQQTAFACAQPGIVRSFRRRLPVSSHDLSVLIELVSTTAGNECYSEEGFCHCLRVLWLLQDR